ncbi:hypothetical protein IFM89_014814 [Coptis chinensis]|uniref:Uncharacterized protein n=1 Tax=Coptis chinensis TaxID=261450 RepID=A0A835IBY2_9MAGN|nr:hypothetical protein IFM89_014814 [Coptis chinensis]
MQLSRNPVAQRGQYKPARGNRKFDRSLGGSDSSESGYNGSRNTRRRANGGYQRAGDRRGRQQWARSHRTGALHNSVGGYPRTIPHRAEANFRAYVSGEDMTLGEVEKLAKGTQHQFNEMRSRVNDSSQRQINQRDPSKRSSRKENGGKT